MKILMATMGLGIGGAETHIVELAKELKRQGHDIIIASNGGVYVEEIKNAGIRHYAVPMNRRSVGSMARSLKLLRRIIKNEKPDIVHAHARIPGFLCGILKKSMKFPFVTTAHWVFDTSGMLRLLTNWGDKTIAVSDDISDYLTDSYGIDKSNIFVTINGIDTEKFSPDVSGERIRQEFGIPGEAKLISHVSRMDESRALAARYLIDIAPDIANRLPGTVILIAGGGNVFEELKQKAEEVNCITGYRTVIMAGPRTDINEIVAAGDIFVGVSRAALEAMAAAKPTVIAGNEGYMGIFDADKLDVGIEGNFCCRGCGEIERERFLGDVISALNMPENEARHLGAYGREVIKEHYSVARMAQDAVTAYKAAMPPRKIIISGYYGCHNAGDEAILESVTGNIQKLNPRAQITVLSRSPEETAEAFGFGAIDRFNFFKVTKAIRTCDVLISGGGGLLQDSTSTRSILYYLAIIRFAELCRKKVILYANGIGPITRKLNRKLTKKAVERADMITLRDPASLEELRDMGVSREDIAVTADPVFSLDMPDEKRTDEILAFLGIPARRYVTVSVRSWGDNDRFCRKFAEVCDDISHRHGTSTVFIVMQEEYDEDVSRKICDYMTTDAYIVPGRYNSRELMGIIRRSELMLSMRLHALIFAAKASTPAVGFVYDPKVEACLEILSQPSAGDIEMLDVTEASDAVSSAFFRREELAERLKNKRDEIILHANENEQYLRRFIEE